MQHFVLHGLSQKTIHTIAKFQYTRRGKVSSKRMKVVIERNCTFFISCIVILCCYRMIDQDFIMRKVLLESDIFCREGICREKSYLEIYKVGCGIFGVAISRCIIAG